MGTLALKAYRELTCVLENQDACAADKAQQAVGIVLRFNVEVNKMPPVVAMCELSVFNLCLQQLLL